MRNLSILTAAAAATLAGCSVHASEDSGQHVARNFTVPAFTEVAVAGPYEVTVRTGSGPSVNANGSEKALENLQVEVRNGTLEIKQRERRHWGFSFGSRRSGPVQLTVTVPALQGASIAGSGGINVDRVAGERFKGDIAGSGDLRVAALDAGDVNFSIAGSGSIQAGNGKAKSVKYEIAGSGDIDAGSLAAENAVISVAGSGNIKGHATGSASIEMLGSGDVEMTGGAKCSISKHGSGDVKCS